MQEEKVFHVCLRKRSIPEMCQSIMYLDDQIVIYGLFVF